MKFLIFDREENYLGTLKDVLEAKHTEEINGEDVLSIATLDKSIGKGYKLAYKDKYGYWKEFIIKEIEESHTNGGIEKRLFCESSFYETFGDYIEDKRPSGTASHALSVALEPTRWEVGIVDDLGTNTASFYRISAKEAVQKVAETWKGEIRTRVEVVGNKIVHRYVDLMYKRGGDYGRRFTYSKNLESVTRTIHRDDVITALYGYGKGEEVGDGFGRRIDFADINGGKAYIENMEALSIWGRNNPDGTKSHVFGKVVFDDIEDPEELLQLTQEAFVELTAPQVTYQAKVIDLEGKKRTIENIVKNVRVVMPYSRKIVRQKSSPTTIIQPVYTKLGDTVSVIDKEFTPELRLKARAVRIVEDLLHPENTDIVLGNFIPNIADSLAAQQKFIDNFRAKQGVWDRSQHIDPDGNMPINNLIDQLNEKLNQQGGYVYLSEDGQGLTTYNKPINENPNMAIQLLGGAFRIANSREPDGTWNWRTFGTGDGFLADEFIGGILRSANNASWINLNNGSFSFENGAFTSGGIDMSTPSNTYFVVRARYAGRESALSALQLKLINEEHNAETFLQARGLWFTVNNTSRLQLGWDDSNNRAYFYMEDSNFSNSLDSQSLTYWSGSQQMSYYDSNGCAVVGPLWADRLYVSGQKNRVVKTKCYGEVLQYAMESPTPIFVDIGHGIIGGDGLCYVDIEEIFSETIDLESDYHIQLTKYGEGDVWVKDRQKNHFVIEGTPNLKFAWEIKAKQKGYSNERLDKHNRFKEDEETDYASLADKYLMEYEKELIA